MNTGDQAYKWIRWAARCKGSLAVAFRLGENATSPDVLFFGNPFTGETGAWSEVS